MAYYVCPTCGAPLTLADPPSLSSRDRPRYDTPQLATCPSCGRLERGPLSERRMRQAPWAFVLAIASVLGVYWAGLVVFTQVGDKDPVVTTFMTLLGVGISITLVALALIVSLVHARRAHRFMAEWQPYRHEGDAPLRQDAHRSSRVSGGQSEGGEMFKRRNWLDWLVIGIIVIAVAGVGVYAYQSYRESREKKEARAAAQAAFETYGDAVMDVRRSYIRAYNKVWGDPEEENYGLLNRVDPWADKLQRAVRALAAIESPDQVADAHAALVGAWRKEVPFIRDHLKTANRVFDNEPTSLLDFDAMDAWTKRLQKEIDIILKADKRVEAAWEKWRAAANEEARRLRLTATED